MISYHLLHPRPHPPLGRPHRTVLHQLGASSLAPFKYPAILFRHLSQSVAPNPSDQYYDFSVIEGLRLMSLLKCVHFPLPTLIPPFLCPTLTLTGFPRLPCLPLLIIPLPPSPSPQTQTGIRAQWPSANPKDQLARRRDARLHTP